MKGQGTQKLQMDNEGLLGKSISSIKSIEPFYHGTSYTPDTLSRRFVQLRMTIQCNENLWKVI